MFNMVLCSSLYNSITWMIELDDPSKPVVLAGIEIFWHEILLIF